MCASAHSSRHSERTGSPRLLLSSTAGSRSRGGLMLHIRRSYSSYFAILAPGHAYLLHFFFLSLSNPHPRTRELILRGGRERARSIHWLPPVSRGQGIELTPFRCPGQSSMHRLEPRPGLQKCIKILRPSVRAPAGAGITAAGVGA